MFADQRANPSQSSRPRERRRLAPYFLAAILMHLVVLIYRVHQDSVPVVFPVGPVSLTLDKPSPHSPLPPPHPLINKPSPAAKPSHKPASLIAIPAKPLTPSANAQPMAPTSEQAPKADASVIMASPAAPGPANATSLAAGPANHSETPVSQPRFDAAYLLNPKPEYPPISRRLGEEGKVLLKVLVTAQGMPAAVDVQKSSGFERLDEAARRIVTRWRFVPAKRGEQPVEASVIVPISFRLDG